MNAVAKEHWPQDVADACRCPLATEATDPVSFLLIEDHPFFIDGLSGAIKQLFPSVELICATSARQGMKYLETKTYDLVFLDLNLPDQNGFELLDALQLTTHIQPVVILTGVVTFSIAELARKKGAVGAISKSLTMDQLKTYCLKLLNGDTVFMPDALQQLEDPGELPTGRELEVLTTLDEGLENSEICSRLSVSDSTLRTHLRNLFAKLKVSNRTACLVQAKKLGWL